MTIDVVAEVKNAVQTFETGMKAFDAFKSELAPKLTKLDALDNSKLEKMANDVGASIEASQKLNASLKAQEEKQKTLEAHIEKLSTALARPGAGMSVDDQAKEIAVKRNTHFNKWAKKHSAERDSFMSYIERTVTDEAERKALTVNAEANGGYLVMPEFGGVIQSRVFETSPVRQLATVETVNTDQYEVILDNDEAAASWVGETQSRSETNTPTLGKLIIPVHELYANPKASQKMLDDGIVDVESWLAGKVSEYFARTEATAFVSGDGVNKPKGLVSYDAGTTLASQQVEQVNSGSAGAFTYAGLVDLQNALKEEYQANAVFLIKRSSNAALMKIVDGNTRPIFNAEFNKNVGLQPTIMGKPVYFANDIAAASSGSLSAIYGDIRRAYMILDRIGIRILRDPFTSKPFVHFYTTKRVGGAVVNFEAYKIQKLT